ncbi:MAG: alpha/beta hydrolase [Candidatus Obscuribacter sp.]|nr:alpha/beta hydrolase [Candidatus Obscuribacter sp.]MBK7840842.1 alpha/beta hydrolase [Candidatus Obscuribacter sp.]
MRLELLFMSTLLVLSTGFVSAKETAATSPSNALAGTSLEDLIDRATSKVLQKYKGKVPANVKTKVLGEINKLTGSKSKAAAAAVAAAASSSTNTTAANATAQKTNATKANPKAGTTATTAKTSGTAATANTTATSDDNLLQAIDQILPDRLMDKLPAGIRTKLSTANTNKFEKLSYWPGLNDQAHQISIYTPPASSAKAPLIIYVHGGSWLSRPKSAPTWVSSFVKNGFAVAVVHYRLSSEGIFPAQIEDLNTCLRWVKTNASKFNIDANRIGLWGSSAGGHLVSLMGTSANNAALDLGLGDKSISKNVQAVCDFCGPSDLVALGSQMQPGQEWDTVSPAAPLSMLLGGQATTRSALALQASPTTYVSANNPPFLIVHGAMDTIVPTSQSQELADKLKAAGVSTELYILPGTGHDIEKGGNIELARQFFIKHLKP